MVSLVFTLIQIFGLAFSSAASPWLATYYSDPGYNNSSPFLVNGFEYPALHYIQQSVPIEDELTYEKLKDLIQSQHLDTIESVIAQLPQYMLNNNYIVMYRSRSLQKATPDSPRIITFTPTARLLLTFNGGIPNHKGANTLEIIQFRDGTRRFEFREITFLSDKKAPQFSEANPKKCLACHQSSTRTNIDMRPNWEPYNVWPGAIGSNNGNLGVPLLEDSSIMATQQPQDEAFLQEQLHEKEITDRFIKIIAPTHPRYSYLGSLNVKTTTNFTQVLSILNFQRVVRLMEEEQALFDSHYELYEMLGKCHYGYNFSSEAFDQLLFYHKNKSELSKYPKAHDASETKFSDRLTWIFEGLGVDTSDWSMDFGTSGRFAFAERFGVPDFTHLAYGSAWFQSHKDSKLSCGQLYKLAETKAKKFPLNSSHKSTSTPITHQKTGSEILKHCSSCHSDGIDAPQIPFDNLPALKKILYKPFKHHRWIDEIIDRTSDMADSEQQMPPQKRMTPLEHKVLRTFLENL